MNRNSKQEQSSDTEDTESTYTGPNLSSIVETIDFDEYPKHPGSKIAQAYPANIHNSKEKRHKSKRHSKQIYKYQPCSPNPSERHQQSLLQNSPFTQDQLAQFPSCSDSDSHRFPVNRPITQQDDEPPRLHKKIVKHRTSTLSETSGREKSTHRSHSKKHYAETDESSVMKRYSLRKKASHISFPKCQYSPEKGLSSARRVSRRQILTSTHSAPSGRSSSQTTRSAGLLHRRYSKTRYPKRCESAQRSVSRHGAREIIGSENDNLSNDGVKTVSSGLLQSRLSRLSLSPHKPFNRHYPEFVTFSQHCWRGSITSHRHSSNQSSLGDVDGKRGDEISQYETKKYETGESVSSGLRRSKTKQHPQIAPVHRKTKKKVSISQPAEDDSQKYFRNEQQVMILHATEQIISYPLTSVHYQDSVDVIHPPPSSNVYERHSSEDATFTLPRSPSPRHESPALSYEDYQSTARSASPPSIEDFSTIPTSPFQRRESSPRTVQVHETLINQPSPLILQDPSSQRNESPLQPEPTKTETWRPSDQAPETSNSTPPRQTSPTQLAPTSSTGFIPLDDQVAKSVLRHPKCPQIGSEHRPPNLPPRKDRKSKPGSLDYMPIWYQKAGPRSSEWFDGSAYYEKLFDTSYQTGAFAPNVRVETMVTNERTRRGIPNHQPYSNEDLKSRSKKNKKKNVMEGEKSEPDRISKQEHQSYVVNLYEPGYSYGWHNAWQAEPKYKKTKPLMSLKPHVRLPFDMMEDVPSYYSTSIQRAKARSVYGVSSVYSGYAAGLLGYQAYSTSISYDEPCNCGIQNCDCLYACTSRKTQGQSKGKEVTSRDRCLNQFDMSACSRGLKASSASSITSKGGRKRSGIFTRMYSSMGDGPGECLCETEDCYCTHEPCASRQRVKRRRKKKKQVQKNFQRRKERTIDDDKCLLCQVDAIERPFSWCMRTFCITWVWSDREFQRHCGRVLEPLPDYAEKPASLQESWLQRTWNRRYVSDELDEDISSIK